MDLNLEQVLLGLIYLHPSVSGYELKSIIKNSTGYFFNASLSQIYPALKSLSEHGYIIFEVEPLVGKQDRKVYTTTPEGQQQLIDWLSKPLQLDESLNAFQDFLLRLTFMGILDDQGILSFLQSGLEFLQFERDKLISNNLSNEKAYLQTDSKLSERYIFIWRFENQYLEEDLNRKIEFVQSMIDNLKGKD